MNVLASPMLDMLAQRTPPVPPPLGLWAVMMMALGQIIAGGVTTIKIVKKRLEWRKRIIDAVGTPGVTYEWIMTIPQRLWYTSLIMVVLVGFIIVVAIVVKFLVTPSPAWTRSATDIALIALILAVALGLWVWFDPIPKLLVLALRRIGQIRFRPGWANAHWHTNNSHRMVRAMQISEHDCERLADIILQQLAAGQVHRPTFVVNDPTQLSDNERPNYILFACVIESKLGDIRQASRADVQYSWNHLAWTATQPSRPFDPKSLAQCVKAGRSFHDLLGPQHANPPVNCMLPTQPVVKSAVDQAAVELVKYFHGKGSKLAKRRLWKGVSPSVLDRRLSKFSQLRGDARGAMRRVYTKVSVRLRLWPELKPGPYRYPYSDGVATLALNSGCLRFVSDIATIPLDQPFRDLVAAVESRVADRCFDHLTSPTRRSQMKPICQKVFGARDPDDLDRWKVCDYVDVLLWMQSGQYCTSKELGRNVKNGSTCSFSVKQGECLCARAHDTWIRKDNYFEKRQ